MFNFNTHWSFARRFHVAVRRM